MTCTCRSRKSSRSSLSSSRTSLPDEVNCSFSSDSSEDRFYRNKMLKLEVGKLLGSGGFGSVFEGRCSGRKIAVKRLHNNIKNPNVVKESFQAEKAVMSLKHRNIVRVLATTKRSKEFKSTNSFVIMEYAGHRNLLSVLNDETERITTFGRIKYATDIANALHYIHKLNIVHLDIKPANIMVTAKNTCKLGDFGCCKILPESGQGSPTTPTSSNLTGTLAYTSPELLKGKKPWKREFFYCFVVRDFTLFPLFFPENFLKVSVCFTHTGSHYWILLSGTFFWFHA